MSDSNINSCTDEERYANDSFETEVPESSESGTIKKKLNVIGRASDYWTCESSSDEDDVILGQTVGEINIDSTDIDESDDLSLTPAARLFQMASASRHRLQDGSISMQASSARENDVEEDEDLTEYDDEYDDDIESFVTTEVETMANGTDAEEIFEKYSKLSTEEEREEERTYHEKVMFNNCMETDMDNYPDVNYEDGGEVDIGDPDLNEDFSGEEEEDDEDIDQKDGEKFKNTDGESDNNEIENQLNINSNHTNEEDQNESLSVDGAHGTYSYRENWQSHAASLMPTNSMEEFKRKVYLSRRLPYNNDGTGTGAGGDGDSMTMKGRRGSGIPVWVGSNSNSINKSMKDDASDVSSVMAMNQLRSRVGKSLSDFSDAETLIPDHLDNDEENNKGDLLRKYSASNYALDKYYIDEGAAGDYNNEYMLAEDDIESNQSLIGASRAYSLEMEMFMQKNRTPHPPRKLKAGERRNMSFSNERLRDIERHNQILLRKILSQKPTYVMDDKKKKSKFTSLPPTTRVSSAEVNRKKQQRQIDLDNQLLKRKLETISTRKPKTKQK